LKAGSELEKAHPEQSGPYRSAKYNSGKKKEKWGCAALSVSHETWLNPVCRRELDAGFNAKSPTAGIPPAVQHVEHADQFHIGNVDDRVVEERVQSLYRGLKENPGFHFSIAR
jgi:hypothetical protein